MFTRWVLKLEKRRPILFSQILKIEAYSAEMASWHGLTKVFLEENIDIVIMISDPEFCAVWNRANLANWENENGKKKIIFKTLGKGVLYFCPLFVHL